MANPRTLSKTAPQIFFISQSLDYLAGLFQPKGRSNVSSLGLPSQTSRGILTHFDGKEHRAFRRITSKSSAAARSDR